MIISVIVYMLTNYLGMPLIYLTADCFFDESEGVYVNVKVEILWFGSLLFHQRENHGALPRPSWLPHISILSNMQVNYVRLFNHGKNTITSVYQWELATHQIFFDRKLMTCSKGLNLFMCVYTELFFEKRWLNRSCRKYVTHSKKIKMNQD